MQLRLLSADEVKKALPMAEAIEAMKSAFAQLSKGQAVVPMRGKIDMQKHQGTTLVMSAYLEESDDLAVKVVSVFPENPQKNEPLIYAMVLVLDCSSGRPLALLEGGTLTAIRTGAVSGAATDLLALPDAQVVAIIGSGVQAQTQLEAVCTVRKIREVRVYSNFHDQLVSFARRMQGKGPIPSSIKVMPDADSAVQGADIICAATTSETPVFSGEVLKPGAHVNAVGSWSPTTQEIDVRTVQRSLVVVDSREAAWDEAGDLIIPLNEGIIQKDHIHAELGELITGIKPGRTDPEQITFFKSVGVAVQDAAAGRVALGNAIANDLGTVADF